ncbi:MAG: PP2C family protein-serine/threonine phosphatase [Blastococcus sp.]
MRALGPAAARDGLNQLIGTLLPGELATVVVVELDPADGAVVVANAGHLPVLHATSAGAEYLMQGRGPALGLLDAAHYSDTRIQLAGDDRLLLLSDGLVERGAGGLAAGLERLRDVVASGPADPHALLDEVLGALNPPGTDDVTLLGIART